MIINERPTNILLTKIRRQDRAVEDESWIQAFLARAQTCSLALAIQAQPYLHFNSFVYDRDPKCIYIHGAQEGGLPFQVSQNDRVSLGIYEMGRLLPGNTAMSVSVEYASVIVRGKIRLLTDPIEAEHALQLMLKKYFPDLQPGRDYRPIQANEVEITNVYRIDILEWNGKQKKAGLTSP